ncbi:MAG: hypothetical protein ACO2OZ_07205 [Acidilobaceae archaeon]
MDRFECRAVELDPLSSTLEPGTCWHVGAHGPAPGYLGRLRWR